MPRPTNKQILIIATKEGYEELLQLINSFSTTEQHTEEQLFTKQFYQWTGTTHLASYLISSSPSHYQWAIKKLKKYRKLV